MLAASIRNAILKVILQLEMKRYLTLITIILITSSCLTLDFSKSRLMGSNKVCRYDKFTGDTTDFYSYVYYGRKHRGVIIPFFAFLWSGKKYGVEFNFSTNNDKYERLDSVEYEIKHNDNLLLSGVLKNVDNKFTCYTDSGYYGKHTRCYASLVSGFNKHQKFIDSVSYHAKYTIYLTDKNGITEILKPSDCKLSLLGTKKVDLMIVPNY